MGAINWHKRGFSVLSVEDLRGLSKYYGPVAVNIQAPDFTIGFYGVIGFVGRREWGSVALMCMDIRNAIFFGGKLQISDRHLPGDRAALYLYCSYFGEEQASLMIRTRNNTRDAPLARRRRYRVCGNREEYGPIEFNDAVGDFATFRPHTKWGNLDPGMDMELQITDRIIWDFKISEWAPSAYSFAGT